MVLRHTMPNGIKPIEAQPYLLGTDARIAFRFSQFALRVVMHGFGEAGGNAAERAIIATQGRRAKVHATVNKRRLAQGQLGQVSQVDMQDAIGVEQTAMSILRAERSDMVRATIDPKSGLEVPAGTVVLGHLTTDHVLHTIADGDFEPTAQEAAVIDQVLSQYEPFKLPREN